MGGELHVLPIHRLDLFGAKLAVHKHALRGIAEGAEGVQGRQNHCWAAAQHNL